MTFYSRSKSAAVLVTSADSELNIQGPAGSSFYVRRNKVARESHAKTWRAKHRGVKFLRL